MRALALILGLATLPLQPASGPYRITHTYTVGGDGGWDYVVPDPPNHRLFVGRSDRVMVLDENTGAVLGSVTGIKGAHGTAVVESAGRGFATSGNDQSVVMFDLKTFATIARIPAAEDADAVIYDAPSNRVFTFNGDAHSSTVIDPQAGKRIKNLDLGGKPEYGASAGDGKVYANLTDISEVVEIDAKAATVLRRWPTAGCKNPVSMAIDTAHHRLFSGCRSGVMAVSDYEAGRVVATVPIGTGVDGAGFDAASGNAFASNADGTLTVIHQDSPDAYTVIQTLPTAVGSRNMGLDPSTHRVFLVSAKFGPAPAGGRGRAPVLPGTSACSWSNANRLLADHQYGERARNGGAATAAAGRGAGRRRRRRAALVRHRQKVVGLAIEGDRPGAVHRRQGLFDFESSGVLLRDDGKGAVPLRAERFHRGGIEYGAIRSAGERQAGENLPVAGAEDDHHRLGRLSRRVAGVGASGEQDAVLRIEGEAVTAALIGERIVRGRFHGRDVDHRDAARHVLHDDVQLAAAIGRPPAPVRRRDRSCPGRMPSLASITVASLVGWLKT